MYNTCERLAWTYYMKQYSTVMFQYTCVRRLMTPIQYWNILYNTGVAAPWKKLGFAPNNDGVNHLCSITKTNIRRGFNHLSCTFQPADWQVTYCHVTLRPVTTENPRRSRNWDWMRSKIFPGIVRWRSVLSLKYAGSSSVPTMDETSGNVGWSSLKRLSQPGVSTAG